MAFGESNAQKFKEEFQGGMDARRAAKQQLKDVQELLEKEKELFEWKKEQHDKEDAIIQKKIDKSKANSKEEKEAQKELFNLNHQNALEEMKSLEVIAKLTRSLEVVERERLKVTTQITGALKKQAEVSNTMASEMTGLQGKLNGMIEKLPFGNIISKQAGLGKALETTTANVSASLQKSFAKGESGVVAFARAGKVAMAGFGAAVKAAMGPLLLIGLIIAAIVMLVKHMMKMTDQARMFSKELGVANSEGSKLQAKFGTLYAEKGIESMKAMNEQLGYNVELSQESANAMNVFNTYGSLAASTMGQVAGNAALIGSDFAEVAKMAKDVASETTGELDILKEIASLSKDTVAHFAGRTKEMVRQAKLAKDMNISLEKTMQVSKGLLDIESSIEAEMTAELLTGKDLNFDAARRLALSGDHAGAVQEITSQVGNMEGMDMIQLESLAAATGMSVGELQGTAQKAEDKTDKRLLKAATATTQMKTLMEQWTDMWKGKLMAALDKIVNSKWFQKAMEFVANNLGLILTGMAISLAIIAASNVVGAIRNLGNVFRGGFKGLGNLFKTTPKVPLTKSGTPDRRFKVNQTTTPKIPTSTPKPGGNIFTRAIDKGKNLVSKGVNVAKTGFSGAKDLVKSGVQVASKASGVVGNTLSKANPMQFVKNTLKSPIVKGFGKVLGPIMVAISGIADVASTISNAKASQMAGGEVDRGALGKQVVQAAAYPIANLATNLIPGFGTAISLTDAILGSFGYSPIKWLTDNLIDLVPNEAFTGLGKLAIGDMKKAEDVISPNGVQDNGKAEDFIVQDNKLTKFRKDDVIVGGTNLGGDGGGGSSDIVERLDKLIELMIAGKTINMDGVQVAKALALNNIDIGVA
jgi:hypothetical protein